MRSLRCRGSALVVLALALTASACRAPPPLHEVRTRYSIVRADSLDLCRRYGALVDDLVPQIRTRLPGVSEGPVELWVQDRLRIYRWHHVPDFVTGFVHTEGARRVHLRADAEYAANALCHELVHALLGERWRPLPVLLEEGLCDHLALELVEDGRDATRTRRLLDGARYLGELEPSLELAYEPPDAVHRFWTINFSFQRPRDQRAAPPREALRFAGREGDSIRGLLNAHHYGFGVWLVGRVVSRSGYDGVLALCDEADAEGLELVKVDAILAAAELGRDEDWQRALLAEFERRDLRVIALENVDGLAGTVAAEINGLDRDRDGAAATLAHCRFDLRLSGCPYALDLLSLPEFLDALEAALSERTEP